MTPTDIKRLRELCEKATPKEWKTSAYLGRSCEVLSVDAGGNVVVHEIANCHSRRAGADSAFIAATRNALPELLDEVERLRAEIRQLEKDHREDMRDAYAEGMWYEREYND